MKKSTLLIIGIVVLGLAIGSNALMGYLDTTDPDNTKDDKDEDVSSAMKAINDKQKAYSFAKSPTWDANQYQGLKDVIDGKYDNGNGAITKTEKDLQYIILGREAIHKLDKRAKSIITSCGSLAQLSGLKNEWDKALGLSRKNKDLHKNTYEQMVDIGWLRYAKTMINKTQYDAQSFANYYKRIDERFTRSNALNCSELKTAKKEAVAALNTVHLDFFENEVDQIISGTNYYSYDEVVTKFRDLYDAFKNADYANLSNTKFKQIVGDFVDWKKANKPKP